MATVKKKVKRRKATPGYEDAVESLAREHMQGDKTIRQIWSFDDPQQEVVRLLEVSDFELPAKNGFVQAVRFGRSRYTPFPLEIALLSLNDWARVQRGTLKLPDSWRGANGREVGAGHQESFARKGPTPPKGSAIRKIKR